MTTAVEVTEALRATREVLDKAIAGEGVEP